MATDDLMPSDLDPEEITEKAGLQVCRHADVKLAGANRRVAAHFKYGEVEPRPLDRLPHLGRKLAFRRGPGLEITRSSDRWQVREGLQR